MERIGIAASKIAKGNLFLYNLCVVLLTILFALLVFFICGTTIFIVLIVFDYINKIKATPDLYQGWMPVMTICLAVLTIVIAVFAFMAVARNIKITRK